MTRLFLCSMGGRGQAGRGGSGSNSNQSGGNWPAPMIVNRDLRQALGKKGKPIPLSEAREGANPNWRTGNDRDSRAYQENCQRVVIAYELRRRGYDVEALPTTTPYNRTSDPLSVRHGYTDRDGVVRYSSGLTGAFKGGKWIDTSLDYVDRDGRRYNLWSFEQADAIEDQMKKWGDGARAIVSVTHGSGGHVFNVEQRNGKTVWIEAQTHERNGKTGTSAQTRNWFARHAGSSQIMRVDNLRISDRAKNFVTTVR